ncbi:Tetraketide alpha-pyrone reductase 2 [Hibiscus syriacus]|uniref:Tetraketide alpha-pyrone reductase 2 n=1 Tax=Hibiscus syriacus TaxID=106335 RepID=A0A6A3C6T5_HIBSY|nr:Tetraketide alpha-pyrone reductase 2 [Hibiscus syriacus]
MSVPLFNLAPNLTVSRLCLGTMTFGEHNSLPQSFRLLDQAFEAGINFFDSAEMYPVPQRAETPGKNEEYFGQWVRKRNIYRYRVVISTKCVDRSPILLVELPAIRLFLGCLCAVLALGVRQGATTVSQIPGRFGWPSGQMSWIRDGPKCLDANNITEAIDGSKGTLFPVPCHPCMLRSGRLLPSMSRTGASRNIASATLFYAYAKTMVEKEVWRVAKETGFDMVVVNPSFVVGSLLTPHPTSTLLLILATVKGLRGEYPNTTEGFVHIDDVVAAHILAMEESKASGRLVCSSSVAHWTQIIDMLRAKFPSYPFENVLVNQYESRVFVFLKNNYMCLYIRFFASPLAEVEPSAGACISSTPHWSVNPTVRLSSRKDSFEEKRGEEKLIAFAICFEEREQGRRK